MNRNKKKLESVQRILKQAIEISTNSDIDVFVSYSGHVDYIEIRVYLQGWNSESEADYKTEIWSSIRDEDYCLKQLEEASEYLRVLKITNNIY